MAVHVFSNCLLLCPMGNSNEDYRAAIGLFNIRKYITGGPIDFRANTYQEIVLTNLRCSFLVVSLFALQSINPNINIVFLLFILYYILIIGNVEVNPGPELDDTSSTSSNVYDNSITICNINIRSIRNKLKFSSKLR